MRVQKPKVMGIGVTWRIQLNDPRAVATQPFVKLRYEQSRNMTDIAGPVKQHLPFLVLNFNL